MGEKMNTPSRVPVDGKFERNANQLRLLSELKAQVEEEHSEAKILERATSKAEAMAKKVSPETVSDMWRLDGEDPDVPVLVKDGNIAQRYAARFEKALGAKVGGMKVKCKAEYLKNGGGYWQVSVSFGRK